MVGGSNARFRVYTLAEFYTVLLDLITHLRSIVRANRSGRISKAFSERIMLAVTQVNGCRYCNYYHTRLALSVGVSSEEVQSLMDGDLENAPQEEQVALLFAQHYADTKGHPDEEACDRLHGTYGAAMASDILAYIRMIMFGNVYGILFDSLWLRIKGSPVEGSNLWQEVGGVFGIFLMIPFIAVRQLLRKLGPQNGIASSPC